jgi:choice-of-anchor B domain-containing protein
MKILSTVWVNMFFISLSFAQQFDFNLTKVAEVNYPEGCNDVWGYVDEDGTEYAILGTREATVVLSLEDPANPIERLRVEGTTSTWRDIKTWGQYAYVTTDVGADGILILNMSGAPDNITWEYENTPLTFNGNSTNIERCHNLWIDEKGVMYLSGCNTGSNGVLMFDLTEDPDNPKFLGAESRFYSHDNYARGDTLWTSDLSQGFSVWDVSDKANPVEMARQPTTTLFTHNAWLSDDGKYLFTTDERPDAYMDAYDVSDLSKIELLDAYRPKATEGRGVIPHNTHYFDGYLVVSWYTDGVKIVDGSRPHNMVEVASYNTWDGPDGGFNGCWGAYPYLPSGLVLASDIQRGLFVLQPEYTRASWLEGVITNNLDFQPVNNVEVVIDSPFENEETSNINGEYATGLAVSGTFDVTFSHPDYQDTTIEVSLEAGEVTMLDVELRAKPFFRVNCNVIDAQSKQPIEGAEIVILNQFRSEAMSTDANGEAELIIFDDQLNTYQIIAGKWGYLHGVIDTANLEEEVDFTIELDEGYQDDFILEQGWTVGGTASRGNWVREDPIGTSVNGQLANPVDDVDSDLGMICFVTGNSNGGAGEADVDEGVTILTSPVMDLAQFTSPEIYYRTWFFNGSRPNPNDSMRILISNGMETVPVEVITQSGSTWRDTSKIKVEEFIRTTPNMQVIVEVYDDIGNGHVTEGAFDEFFVVGRLSTSNEADVLSDVEVYPTLVTDHVKVIWPVQSGNGRLLSTSGRLVESFDLVQGENRIAIPKVPNGTYLLELSDGGKGRVVKALSVH